MLHLLLPDHRRVVVQGAVLLFRQLPLLLQVGISSRRSVSENIFLFACGILYQVVFFNLILVGLPVYS